MSEKFIPCIYSGDLPSEVQEELENIYQNHNLCFHGDNGCIFTVWDQETLDKLPLFKEWMINESFWPENVILYSYKTYLNKYSIKEDSTDNYKKYKEWLKESNNKEFLRVAMRGT